MMTQAAQNTDTALKKAQIFLEVLPAVNANCKTGVLKNRLVWTKFSLRAEVTYRGHNSACRAANDDCWWMKSSKSPPAPFLLMALCLFMSSLK